MRISIILIIITIIIFPSTSLCLSDSKYKEFIQRDDFRNAENFLAEAWKELRGNIEGDIFKKILLLQRQWIKNGREKEVAYLKKTQPFYDEIRMYSISTMARANFIKKINESLSSIGTSKDFDKIIKNINYVNLLNFYAKKLDEGDDPSVMTDSLIFCTYNNYDDVSELLGLAAEILFAMGGKAESAGNIAEMASYIDRQEFCCHFRRNVTKYSVALFYDGLFSKFFNKETHNISENDMFNGFRFSSTTLKSSLDFVTIRVNANINNDEVKFLYAFEIDRKNKKLERIDPNKFINDFLPQYKEE